jgi:hypothetical protein
MIIILFLLNYFWLSWDPEESAKWYCDQHCFKIGSEVVESVWDSVLVLAPELDEKADLEGITPFYRKQRHAKKGGLWHPLSVWHGLCRANMKRGLENANAIFKEHQRRTGKSHTAWSDCKFLIRYVDEIDFQSDVWKSWYRTQNGTPNEKTKSKDLASRHEWCKSYAPKIKKLDRNTCEMTRPPLCVGTLLENVDPLDDPIEVYRRYYEAKTKSVSGGMRYFYTTPPEWLTGNVVTERKNKSASKPPIKYRLVFIELDF